MIKLLGELFLENNNDFPNKKDHELEASAFNEFNLQRYIIFQGLFIKKVILLQFQFKTKINHFL